MARRGDREAPEGLALRGPQRRIHQARARTTGSRVRRIVREALGGFRVGFRVRFVFFFPFFFLPGPKENGGALPELVALRGGSKRRYAMLLFGFLRSAFLIFFSRAIVKGVPLNMARELIFPGLSFGWPMGPSLGFCLFPRSMAVEGGRLAAS